MVAGNWVTPIYGHILRKWKNGAIDRGMEVAALMLLARSGTIAFDTTPDITYVELTETLLKKTG
jgi:hypothetical protein